MNTIATVSRPRWLTIVGILGIVCMGFTVWLGLWVTPPDQVQGNLARLLYIHPPIATVALYWAGGVALAGSLLYLWPRTRSFFWDRLAAASVEVGAVFSALTCVTGSIWGRPAWGVWWRVLRSWMPRDQAQVRDAWVSHDWRAPWTVLRSEALGGSGASEVSSQLS